MRLMRLLDVLGERGRRINRFFTDAALFFAREEVTQRLVTRVRRESFLAIVGASGSGKSSIARAGLVPAVSGMGG